MKSFLVFSVIIHLAWFGALLWLARPNYKDAYSNVVTSLDVQVVQNAGKPPRPEPARTAPKKSSEEIPLNGKGKNSDPPAPASAAAATGNSDGADSALPVPTAEYLVTKMPRLAREFRVTYPAEAKQRGIQGPVVMDLLIDAYGKVRQVQVVSGPDATLIAAAREALMKFEFEPAEADGKTLAVRTRYIYEFVLER